MDEAGLAADFVAKNIEKIWGLGKSVFGRIDGSLKLKLKTAYSEYLKNTEAKYSKSKSFFIRDRSVDLYSYYVPVGVSCGNVAIETPSFEECLKISSHIVFSGLGGSGKSILMRHLYLDCMRDKQYVPILIELRDLNGSDEDLSSLIFRSLNEYGFSLPEEYVDKAKSYGHFSFFLDGFDEVNHSLRRKLLKDLRELSRKYKDCPVFVSTRPEDVFNGIDDYDVFHALPLSRDKAVSLVEKLPFDAQIKSKFIDRLEEGLFEKHESFLSNPLLLSIMLLTYGENAEIPTKLSIFYNQAYEALFQRHDANKGGYKRVRLTDLDIHDFSKVFSLFSLQTYEKRLFKMPRTDCLKYIEKSKNAINKDFDSESYLNDLLSAACLLIEDGLEISYSHRSFQEYFVALYILSAPPEVQDKLINRYWKNSLSDNVINLLTEMNQDLVERVLVIPMLDRLFDQIGVKKKVGVTHTTKYIKMAYDKLSIAEDSISASWKGFDANISQIVRMAYLSSDDEAIMDPSDHKKFVKYMYETYGDASGRSIEYATPELTHRTPVLVDLLHSKTFLSVDYLEAAFRAYKKLKQKHSSHKKSIEDLLGI